MSSSPGFGKRLREYLASQSFEKALETFLNANARTIHETTTLRTPTKIDEDRGIEIDTKNVILSGEFSLEAHAIWQQYLQVIEDNMDAFMQSEGLTAVEFKTVIEDLPKSQSMLVRLMIASWEFEQFVDLCKDHCEYMEEQRQNGEDLYNEAGDGDGKDNYELGDSKYESKFSDSKVNKNTYCVCVFFNPFLLYMYKSISGYCILH